MTVKTETVKQDWTGVKSEGLAQSVKATLYIYNSYIYIYMTHLIEKVLCVLAGGDVSMCIKVDRVPEDTREKIEEDKEPG